MSKQEEKKRATVDRCCDPTSESENTDEDDVSIKDELIRRDVQVLTARLYDLRERFMKIVHKINDDAKDFQDSTSEEGKHFQNSSTHATNTVFFSLS